MKLLVEWLAKLPERPHTIFKTCAYGVTAGLVAVAFQLAMNGCYLAGIVRLSICQTLTAAGIGVAIGDWQVQEIFPLLDGGMRRVGQHAGERRSDPDVAWRTRSGTAHSGGI
jgi:hypothetical protein